MGYCQVQTETTSQSHRTQVSHTWGKPRATSLTAFGGQMTSRQELCTTQLTYVLAGIANVAVAC
ncbi:hypothetical protein EYZ11_006502 [Aspergillus tanneri]|uniref:Uncharacterized protein n=1 Tax=Aspergillus tanneri TaxID=1220188 RepID=A0A4S3JFQ8_9EURO|nr:hypothetical protein EYZ11_006502 [Aspergillus tanneri]